MARGLITRERYIVYAISMKNKEEIKRELARFSTITGLAKTFGYGRRTIQEHMSGKHTKHHDKFLDNLRIEKITT